MHTQVHARHANNLGCYLITVLKIAPPCLSPARAEDDRLQIIYVFLFQRKLSEKEHLDFRGNERRSERVAFTA